MKSSKNFRKVRADRIKYLKLFPLFIQDIDHTEESEDHWPTYLAQLVDNLIIVPDVEQAEKLFRYGSFGRAEFTRTTTQVQPVAPLKIVFNNEKCYEKPFRLRSIEWESSVSRPVQTDDQMSDFERDFLNEFNEKFFAESVEKVRQNHHFECQQILQRSNLNPSASQRPFVPNPENDSSSSLIVYEPFYLLPEETIFLQHALGCLQVHDQFRGILSIDDLWERFVTQDQYFPIKYAVYYYYRSAGWIVKCGLKFGCDYMLYRFGPTYNHADYCVSIENFWKNSSSSWTFLAGLNRACVNSNKTLLITHVDFCKENNDSVDAYLENAQIQSVEVHRWIPAHNQLAKNTK